MQAHPMTAALAVAGREQTAEATPALPIATTAKLMFDTGISMTLAVEEWRENKALCACCQVASLGTIAVLALSLPEAGKALRRFI